MRKFLLLLLVLLLTACAGTPVKSPTYDTATLLFYSDDRLTITGKFINVPKEIPVNFTKLPYNEVFGWTEHVCEMRFAESKGSFPFYSVFAFRKHSKVLALAKVEGIEGPALFWIYNTKGDPIRASYEELKKTLNLPKDIHK